MSEVFNPDKKPDLEVLDPVLEVNENIAAEIFDRPQEENEIEEIPPRIFGLKYITEPLTLRSLRNAIYELGVVNLCWPQITDPVFETRTCFPKSYYTNSSKERLLLAYAENFRRQFHFHYNGRKPLLLQAPNECGLQKMVCTTIRPTKLCYADTSNWEGLAALVSDYFDYEPLTKPMLHRAWRAARRLLAARCVVGVVVMVVVGVGVRRRHSARAQIVQQRAQLVHVHARHARVAARLQPREELVAVLQRLRRARLPLAVGQILAPALFVRRCGACVIEQQVVEDGSRLRLGLGRFIATFRGRFFIFCSHIGTRGRFRGTRFLFWNAAGLFLPQM
ncbi:hypothetical protein O3G_MSEX013506 [Manduca sexta]|uniref:Uncharacterized protein n=1 Tax=Manduca sexta TaxID=7130 RepID=A0A921ZTB2_MANSE|nr:hypothetical protein O3G_MSEX013506 [Manduca sexta]